MAWLTDQTLFEKLILGRYDFKHIIANDTAPYKTMRKKRYSRLLGVKLELTTCAKNQCKNGGTCMTDIKALASFHCICDRGYFGPLCEEVSEACSFNPCRNAGYCVVTLTGAYCVCNKGRTGKHCEFDLTSDGSINFHLPEIDTKTRAFTKYVIILGVLIFITGATIFLIENKRHNLRKQNEEYQQMAGTMGISHLEGHTFIDFSYKNAIGELIYDVWYFIKTTKSRLKAIMAKIEARTMVLTKMFKNSPKTKSTTKKDINILPSVSPVKNAAAKLNSSTNKATAGTPVAKSVTNQKAIKTKEKLTVKKATEQTTAKVNDAEKSNIKNKEKLIKTDVAMDKTAAKESKRIKPDTNTDKNDAAIKKNRSKEKLNKNDVNIDKISAKDTTSKPEKSKDKNVINLKDSTPKAKSTKKDDIIDKITVKEHIPTKNNKKTDSKTAKQIDNENIDKLTKQNAAIAAKEAIAAKAETNINKKVVDQKQLNAPEKVTDKTRLVAKEIEPGKSTERKSSEKKSAKADADKTPRRDNDEKQIRKLKKNGPAAATQKTANANTQAVGKGTKSNNNSNAREENHARNNSKSIRRIAMTTALIDESYMDATISKSDINVHLAELHHTHKRSKRNKHDVMNTAISEQVIFESNHDLNFAEKRHWLHKSKKTNQVAINTDIINEIVTDASVVVNKFATTLPQAPPPSPDFRLQNITGVDGI